MIFNDPLFQFFSIGYLFNLVVWLFMIFGFCTLSCNPPRVPRRVRVALFCLLLFPYALPAGLCLYGTILLIKQSVRFVLYGDCEAPL